MITACMAVASAIVLGDVAPDSTIPILGYVPYALPPLGLGLILYLRARHRASSKDARS